MLRLVMIAVLAALCTACVAPERFVKPEGEEAEQCLEYCHRERIGCLAPQTAEQAQCLAYRERRQARWQSCTQRSPKSSCGSPPGAICVSSETSRECRDRYRICFVGCGGQIETSP